MKTIKIEIPDNKEIIWKDDNTLAVVDSDITGRVKTFKDALNELGDKHPLVIDYNSNIVKASKNLIAYLRLRIIIAALNEGWEPKFEKGEVRYFPWFCFYTKKQYDKLEGIEKRSCVLCSNNALNTFYGFAYYYMGISASYSSANKCSRHAFKTRKLAEYAGKQFTQEYFDYLIS